MGKQIGGDERKSCSSCTNCGFAGLGRQSQTREAVKQWAFSETTADGKVVDVLLGKGGTLPVADEGARRGSSG